MRVAQTSRRVAIIILQPGPSWSGVGLVQYKAGNSKIRQHIAGNSKVRQDDKENVVEQATRGNMNKLMIYWNNKYALYMFSVNYQ